MEAVPARSGVGLKPEHYGAILEDRPDLGFIEIHAENYMGDGGPPHHYLERIRADYPLSLHGVGLSIGGAEPLDRDHLARLKAVADRYAPGLISEHLAWSSHGGVFYNDLLPLPYTEETLNRVADHVARTQDTLGRRILIENPASYLAFATATLREDEFLRGLQARTGCGLLFDVNNLYISAINLGVAPDALLDAFPLGAVEQIHLAGHGPDHDEDGTPLLIDTHDRAVAGPVWDLFADAIARTGPLPTLIEWDTDIPVWDTLHAEARRAESVLVGAAVAAMPAAGYRRAAPS